MPSPLPPPVPAAERALTDEIDPTREIRTLIDQLQLTARDSRGQVRAIETERDALARQLDEARRHNEQNRARLKEVDALARERDAAVRDAERQAHAASEAQGRITTLTRDLGDTQRQRDDALRIRDEIIAQRDDAIHRRDEAARQREEVVQRLAETTRTAHETGPRFAELQKQLLSVRQARDTALAQNLELSKALAETKDQLEDSLQSWRGEEALDEAQREVATLRAELAAALSRPAPATDPAALTEARRALAELQQESESKDRQTAELEARAADMARRMGEVQGKFDYYVHERDAAQNARDEAVAALHDARKQAEKLVRERDLIRQESGELSLALETQIEALRVQVASLESTDAGGAAHNAKLRELAALLEDKDGERADLVQRLESQRIETIDLAAQLHSAQEEIRKLTGKLGEARLQAKLGANGKGSRAQVLKTLGKGDGHAPSRPQSPAPLAPAAAATAPLDSLAAQDALNALHHCYHTFVKNTDDITPLQALHTHAGALAESARLSGIMALHRIAASLTSLAHELYRYPGQINAGNLRTICQAIDFLGILLRVADPAAVKDPAGSIIYAVEDDEENGRCIAAGLETAGLRTTCLQEPVSALCELAATSCELIILDINLPGMNGFELCTEIRQFALHRTTPVIFLTGMTGPEHRAQSSLSGGDDFVAKPFILSELTLKALMLILKGQLHIA